MTGVVIVNAGMSEGSSTAQLGRAVEGALRQVADGRGLPEPEVTWVDLRPLAHPIADALLTGFAGTDLQEALDRVGAADALVALTPTYQASYSGLFKSFWDVVPDGLVAGIPVLLGATGGSARHALVTEGGLRPLAIHLRADPVPTAVFAATEDWGAHASDSSGHDGERRGARVRRAAAELLDRVADRDTEATDQDEPRESPSSAEPPQAPSAREECPGFVDFETLLARGGVE